jgi:DNA-directed RNA polymerase subunit E'/Rpb7
MTNIFIKNNIEYTLSIDPSLINKKIDNILRKKIKDEIEGKCIKEGYVKRDSVKILFRSPGEILTSHFNGNILYHLKLQLEICNPLEGDTIDVVVRNINKMGILGESGDGDVPPISVLLAKQHHIDNTVFESLKINHKIKVKIIGKRFEYGDTQINIIGVLENQEPVIDLNEVENSNNDEEPMPDILDVELKEDVLGDGLGDNENVLTMENPSLSNAENSNEEIETVDLGDASSKLNTADNTEIPEVNLDLGGLPEVNLDTGLKDGASEIELAPPDDFIDDSFKDEVTNGVSDVDLGMNELQMDTPLSEVVLDPPEGNVLVNAPDDGVDESNLNQISAE